MSPSFQQHCPSSHGTTPALQSKFDPEHETMYACYPPDGFGLEGVKALLATLKK